MKKLFTLLIFALLAITSAWAETLTYTYALDDPDAYPTGFPTKDGTIASAEEFIISGHPLIINAPNYYIINSTSTNGSRGLIFGKSTTTLETAYLQFPAVAGYALTKVEVTTTSNQATSTKCNIYSTSWSAMSTAVTLGKSTTSTFELTNPQANTAYRFATSNSSKNIQLTGITLTYESTSTSGKTATTLSFGSDWDGKEITKYIGEAVFTCPIATLTPTVEGATITYSSSDENVAAIVDGTIMLGDAGTTTISASYAGNDNYEASSASFTINLQKLPDPTFSVKDGSYVVAGTEVTITAPENCTISYIINDGEVQYSATNTEKITINEGTTILACSRYQGAKNIVESEGAEATYNIKTLESIAISGTPNKTAYAPGEAFNTTGLTVTPKYSDGSTSPAISGATLTFAPETFSMGDNTVTVTATYGELTDTKTFDVTVQGFESGTYTLVTSADALVDGAEYVLLTTDGNFAASTYGSNKITTVAAGDNTFSLVGNVVTTYSTSVNVLTIAASDTKWTITDQDGVKFASSGSNTNITNGSGTFTISFDEDGNVSIVGVSGRLWLSNGTVIGNYSSSNANASDYSKLKLYKSGGVALPAKPTFDPEDGTTFTESLKVTITPDDGCKVKYQLGEAEAVTAADTNPVELTLTESTTITAWSVDASDETRVSPSATAKYTKIDPTKTYSLVTSDDQLESGAEYVLVNKTGDKIASKFSIDKITTVGSTDNYDLDTN
ncbi:MAG: bacterial Ig-like domain-containing protein, partial [Sodaliphilus sp.]